MPEDTSENTQRQERSRNEIPYLYLPSLAVLDALAHTHLFPADDPKQWELLDPYGVRQTLEALSDKPNPGRFYPLDQYLTATIVLRPFLDGTGEIITDPSQLPKDQVYDLNTGEAPPLRLFEEYTELAEAMKNLQTLPVIGPKPASIIEIIVNRAYEARAFTLGVSPKNFPALEYPIGFQALPDFIHIAHSGKGRLALILIHRALQNIQALQHLIANEDSPQKTPPINAEESFKDKPITVPVFELKAQVIAWAKHLKEGWQEVTENTVIHTGRNSLGLPDTVSVQGWAKLDLDYDFVHLARKKLSVLMEYRMRIHANHGAEDVPLLDMLSEEEKIDFLLGAMNDHFNKEQPDNWKAKFFLPEYRLLEKIFWDVYYTNQLVIDSNVNPLPGDVAALRGWIEELRNDPTALEMDSSGNVLSIPGICTDIPSDDITKGLSALEPLLVDEVHDELVTPQRPYSMYVHPKIWQEVGKILGSPLKLQSAL